MSKKSIRLIVGIRYSRCDHWSRSAIPFSHVQKIPFAKWYSVQYFTKTLTKNNIVRNSSYNSHCRPPTQTYEVQMWEGHEKAPSSGNRKTQSLWSVWCAHYQRANSICSFEHRFMQMRGLMPRLTIQYYNMVIGITYRNACTCVPL